jgi:hypothetical protein
MSEQAATQKIKSAIRYTLGSKVPHYDFTSIRSDSNDIFFDPSDVHNVTTRHFHNHFKSPDDSPNFTVDYTNKESLESSKSLFMSHPNHQTITLELRELLWTALTRPQTTLMAPDSHQPLRAKLRDIYTSTPSFTQFLQTLHTKSNDSSPGPSGLSYRLLKLLEPSSLELIYTQLAAGWAAKHIPDWWMDKLLVPLPKSTDPSDVIPLSKLRPITLIEVLRKLWVDTVFSPCVHFWESHNLLHQTSHGYRARKGCDTALLNLINLQV